MASYAKAIRDSLDVEVQAELGSKGQFDVLVNGQIVVSRKGGLLALLFRKPWPSEAAVVRAVQSAIG